MAAHYRLVVPVAILQTKRKDALMLLRLGAGVNAMDCSIRFAILPVEEDDVPMNLSRVHSLIASVGYLGEMVRMLDKAKSLDRLWGLVQAAVDDGFPLEQTVDEVKPFLTLDHPQLGNNVLLKIRDKIGFHWDYEAFEGLLDDPDVTDIILTEHTGESIYGRIFRGSAEAMAHYVEKVGGVVDFVKLFGPIQEAQGIIARAVEAAWVGLLLESGENPQKFLVNC